MPTEHSTSHAMKDIRVLESENVILKARLYSAGRENKEYKRQLAGIRNELKETQALLGRAIVAESLNKRLITKRHQSRSPSLEIIELPILFKNEEPLASTPIKLERPLSQQAIDEEMEKPAKRRKLDLAPELFPLEFQMPNTITIDLTLDEIDDMVQGSSASEVKGGDQKENSLLVKNELDELPSEGEIPGPLQVEMPLCTDIQVSASAPISDTQLCNFEAAVSPPTLTSMDESRANFTWHEENDAKPGPSTFLDVEMGITSDELESHPDPPQISTSEGSPVSESSKVDEIPKDPIPFKQINASSAGVRESSAFSSLSYVSDQPTASSSALMESSCQTTPSSAGVQESSATSTPGQLQGQAFASSSASTNSVANPAIFQTWNPTDQKVFNLSPSVIEAYLQSSSPLTILPPPLNIEVSRAFLHAAYGGNDQTFLQYIPAHRNPSDRSRRRQLVFPLLSLNPAMPSRPGLPGLIFASRHEILEKPPWTLFCKRSNATPAVWLYYGEYENTLVGVMTPEQFRSQTPQVQNEWAISLLMCKKFDVYVAMRARIALRKTGLLPVVGKTNEEKEEEEKSRIETEILKIKHREGIPLDRGDIIAAFCKGEEAIDIIRMRCVRYDHVFANDMKQKLPQYSARLAAEKEQRLLRASNTRKKTAMAKRQIDEQSSTSPYSTDGHPCC